MNSTIHTSDYLYLSLRHVLSSKVTTPNLRTFDWLRKRDVRGTSSCARSRSAAGKTDGNLFLPVRFLHFFSRYFVLSEYKVRGL